MLLILYLPLFLNLSQVVTSQDESDDPEEQLYQDDIIGCRPSANPACPLQTSRPPYYKVLETVFIPYVIDQSLKSLEDDIIKALRSVTDQTKCIDFAPADNALNQYIPFPEKPQIRFTRGDACAGQFDRARVPVHTVFLTGKCGESGGEGRIQQLVMLALGFPHEISRSDRDEYVTINLENIPTERKAELNKNKPGVFDNLPYDYDSLLHPGYQFLAKTNSAPTLIPKDMTHKIGQLERLSAGDITKLKNVICLGSQPPRPKPTPPVKKPEENTPKVVTVTVTTTEPAEESTDVASLQCRPDNEDCEQANPSTGIQPSVDLSLAPCLVDQKVILQNTQTMSRTFINGMDTLYKDATRRSTRWFEQNAAGVTKDYLTEPVEYREFAGAVRTVTTKVANRFTKVLQTEYEPSVSPDGGNVRQQKIETRVMQCNTRAAERLRLHQCPITPAPTIMRITVKGVYGSQFERLTSLWNELDLPSNAYHSLGSFRNALESVEYKALLFKQSRMQ